MITTRLQHALQRLDELPPQQQDELARLIERLITPVPIQPSDAEAMRGLPDDFEEELMRRRHEVPPTPPLDEQLNCSL